eukprot:g10218.t1
MVFCHLVFPPPQILVFFFAISIRSATSKRLPRVHLKPVFTTMFSLNKGESADLDELCWDQIVSGQVSTYHFLTYHLVSPYEPIVLIENKRFKLAYAELEKHVLQIDLWEVNIKG